MAARPVLRVMRGRRPRFRRGVRQAVLLLALVWLLSPVGPADAAARLALVAANADYRGELPDLPNARNDGVAVADALESLGFEVLRAFDADRATFERRYAEFRERARDAQMALFYYAGHAVQVNGVNYLLPVGTAIRTLDDLKRNAIAAQPLLVRQRATREPRIFLFDSCRNNPFASVVRPTPTRGIGSRDGLAEMDPGLNTLLVYATSPGDEALDGEGDHSPFTEGLLRYIAEPGLEVRQLVTRVRRYVVDLTQGDQIPWDHSSLLRDVYLAPDLRVASREPVARPTAPEPVPAGAVAAAEDGRRSIDGENDDVWAIIGLGRAARNRGAIREARDRFAQALDMASALGRREEKGVALAELAAAWQELGDLSKAERFHRRARDLRQELVAAEPDEPRWWRDLARSWTGLGDVWQAQGRLERAGRAYEEALRLRRRLVRTDGSNRLWQRELFVGLTRMGDLARARGDNESALGFYEDALGIARRLVEREPDSADRLRDLAVALVNVADLRHFLGQSRAAEEPAAEAVAIVRRLATAFPDRADYRRDLGVAANIRGDVLLALDEFGAAEVSYREALRIRDELARMDPDNATWRRDLSVSWIKLGDVLRRRDQLQAAARAYEAALDIRRRLAAADPTNADWVCDLMVPHFKLALVAERRGDFRAAAEAWGRALETLRGLEESGRLRPADRRLLRLFEERRRRALQRVEDPATRYQRRRSNVLDAA